MVNTTAPVTRRALRARRRRGRLHSLLVSTLATGVAVTLGVASAGVTTAFLTASASAPGGTITAGTLELQINGAPSAALGAWEPTPNTPAVKSFTITNIGDATADLSAAIAVTAPAPALTSHVTARLTPVANAAACVAGLAGTQAPIRGYAATNVASVAAGASRVFCLEMAITPGAPSTVAGQSLAFTMTVSGLQSAS